jgi:hypothetical protein
VANDDSFVARVLADDGQRLSLRSQIKCGCA